MMPTLSGKHRLGARAELPGRQTHRVAGSGAVVPLPPAPCLPPVPAPMLKEPHPSIIIMAHLPRSPWAILEMDIAPPPPLSAWSLHTTSSVAATRSRNQE